MAKAKKRNSTSTARAVGISAAAAVAAAAGAYWFYGSRGAAKHRKTARSWMLKARGDVLEAVETAVKKAGEVDQKTYMNIVKGVLKRYSKRVGVTPAEMLQMTRDMKEAWQHMQKVGKHVGTKKVKKAIKKVSRRVR